MYIQMSSTNATRHTRVLDWGGADEEGEWAKKIAARICDDNLNIMAKYAEKVKRAKKPRQIRQLGFDNLRQKGCGLTVVARQHFTDSCVQVPAPSVELRSICVCEW
jgi:hypothetical protein